jgi:hypothetical protein
VRYVQPIVQAYLLLIAKPLQKQLNLKLPLLKLLKYRCLRRTLPRPGLTTIAAPIAPVEQDTPVHSAAATQVPVEPTVAEVKYLLKLL